MITEQITASGVLATLDQIGWWGALVMVLVMISYGLVLIALSRWSPRRIRNARRRTIDAATAQGGIENMDSPRMVILMPCLNEAEVIVASVKALLASNAPNMDILVIDDGSDDGTADLVEAIGHPRVSVMRRVLPNARKGKGRALNAALAVVRERYVQGSTDDVVIGVVDADGRLDPHAISEARIAFADHAVGAVQMGVRINNRKRSLLARMQDMEFVIFTDVYQRARRHFRSVGMGGNGQFVRLSALDSLGAEPWSDSLTEDFDLGIRLNGTGWVNEYCREASVHQQGVTTMSRLIRQRTRWFQGNLQGSRLFPSVVTTHNGRSRTDTLFQILTPYLILTASLLTISFAIAIGAVVTWAIQGVPQRWGWLIVAYCLAFGPALIQGFIYWRIERRNGFNLLKAAACTHLYVFYGMLGYVPAWWAVARAISGRTNWAKTARETEDEEAQLPGNVPAVDPLAAPGQSLFSPGETPALGSPIRVASLSQTPV